MGVAKLLMGRMGSSIEAIYNKSEWQIKKSIDVEG